MRPHITAFLAALLALIIITSSASPTPAASVPAAPDYTPVTTGPLGSITTRDGDSGFDVSYYAAPNFTGAPVMTRFEARIDATTNALAETIPAGRRGSARWSAAVTPARTGDHPFSLLATGPATLKIDGETVIHHTTPNTRATATIALRQAKSYDFTIEFPDANAAGQITLEWAPPTALASSPSPALAPSPSPTLAPTSAPALPTPAPAPAQTETAAGPRPGERIAAPARIENANYAIDSQPDGTLTLTEKRTGARADFAPEFLVVFQPAGRETKLDSRPGKYTDSGPTRDVNYLVTSWEKETDFFTIALPRARLRATRVTPAGNTLLWTFPAQPACTLTATITAPADGSEPTLAFRLAATAPGQFSIGYAGAPSATIAKAGWIWQPLVWQDKRFPNRSYLTREFQCPIPFAMAGIDGNAIGVGADAREIPFRMPTGADSRFGVLVRNPAGHVQPMLFAPVLGGPESRITAGASYTFTLRLVARRGPWFDTYKHLATTLNGFRDIRENTLCNLNTTLENLTDFFLDDNHCYWFPKYKTWGYQNDAGPGVGRQQSAADPLSLALVLDRADILRRRALPTLEYMLSRKTTQGPFTDPAILGENFRYPVDLVAAHRLTLKRNPLIAKKILPALNAPKPTAGNHVTAARALRNHLAAHRLTGDKTRLDAARAAAATYIDARLARPATTFAGAPSNFWPDLAPSYDYLYELYNETADPRHLRAAAEAMRAMTAFVYMEPIPDAPFTANPGGTYNNQPVPEETVPAWVVSANGLAAECAATSHSHRAIFMSLYYAGYMNRLARDTREPLFTDIARNAVVGRYANYPSYAYRNGYTTLHQKPGYPLRPFEEIKKFTSAHYNHPLPMAALLVDYLVTDTYARSDARIDFPSEYTYSGAYFRNKTYGNRPGRFYDERDIRLWLPKNLVSTDSIQLNYIAARGNGKLYLAFSNQTARPVRAAIAISPARAQLPGTRNARVWLDNAAAPPITITDGRATIEVSPKGLTCLAIDDAATKTEIQDAMLDPAAPPLPAAASATLKTPVGPVTATALRLGRGLTTIHVWLQAGAPAVARATLHCATTNGRTEPLDCAEFPFEFTVPVPDDAPDFRATLDITTTQGAKSTVNLRLPLK